MNSDIDEAASVLLLAPSLASGTDAVCADLLGADRPPNVLWIAYGGRPDRQLERWRTTREDSPAAAAVVVVSEGEGTVDAGSLPYDPRVETVSNPSDLTGLGIHITELLREWEDDPAPTRVCFDSITSMLQYVEFETAYKFLHVVSGRTYAMDATIHFHLDPGAHDDRTVASLATLCDAIVDVTDETIETRTR